MCDSYEPSFVHRGIRVVGVGVVVVLFAVIATGVLTGTAAAQSAPMEEFNRTYDRDSSAANVIQTSDGGFALAGSTESFGSGGDDAWLIKTDANGNEEFNMTFGGEERDRARSIVQTSDAGFALAGTTSSFGSGDSDAWLIKTDANGNKEFDKTFGGTESPDGSGGREQASSVVQTSDGGFALAGGTDSFSRIPESGTAAWLIKTDENGNEEFNKTYESGDDSVGLAFSVVQTSDGGFALAGTTSSIGPGDEGAWLIKTGTNGNKQWDKIFGGDGGFASSIVQTSDGGFAIAGEAERPGGVDARLIKTDSNGNVEINETFGGSMDDRANAVVQTSDGGYALAGRFGFRAWFIKTDANGNTEINETYDGFFPSSLGSVVETSDGEYALGGTAFGSNAWLIKTDLNGNTPPTASFTFTPNSPDTSDTVSFDASGSSDTDGTVTSYDWDFGDGTTATGETATHSFPGPGDYTVTLTVTDGDGATDTTSRTVTVEVPPGDNAWPQFQFDTGNTGHNPDATGPTDDVQTKWTPFSTGDEARSPVVAGGTVYFGSTDDSVYAVDASTGNQKWTFTTSGDVKAPAVSSGTAYVGSQGGSVYALDVSDGTEQWEWNFPDGGASGAPTVTNDAVYIPGADDRFFALDTSDGSELWSIFTGECLGGQVQTPAVSGSTVYITEDCGKTWAVNGSNGNVKWKFDDGSGRGQASPPTARDGTVYFGTVKADAPDGNKLFAVDAATGTEKWQFSFTPGGDVKSSPAVANGKVFFGSTNGNVYALDASDGTEVWNFSTGDEVTSSPAVVNGVVYIGSDDGNLYLIDASSGNEISRFNPGSSVDTSPAVADGNVYLGSGSDLYGLGEGNGNEPTVKSGDVRVGSTGETGESAITVDAENGMSIARLNVSVDTSVAEIQSVSEGADVDSSQPAQTFNVIDQTPDSVRIEYSNLQAQASPIQDFEVARIEFEAQTDDGEATIGLDTDALRDGNTDSYGIVSEDEGIFSVGALFTEPLPGFSSPPQNTGELDPNLFEDADGDGDGTDPTQAVTLWTQLVINEQDFDDLTQEQIDALDWNGDGQLTPADAVSLWTEQVLN